MILRIALALLLTAAAVQARLGDTLGQLQERYGLQLNGDKVPKYPAPLLDGAKEYTFEFQGYYVRCALLQATNGESYAVRQEYRKIYRPNVVLALRDFEQSAILEGEAMGLKWNSRLLGGNSPDPLQAIANQFAKIGGLKGTIWVREDGAIARMNGTDMLTVELPSAAQYEEQMRKYREAKERAAVPRF